MSANSTAWPGLPALQTALRDLDPALTPADALRSLVRAGLGALPRPAHGATLLRWQALAAVAAHDLSLAKLYEGHTDALAIRHELGATQLSSRDATWGTWAAEAPDGRTHVVPSSTPAGSTVTLRGRKCWCSGAAEVDFGLLTAWWDDAQAPQLVEVAVRQPGVHVDAGSWAAVGMAGSASVDVAFTGANAGLVGRPGDYLSRAGFWHGGAGVAACWYGGALALAAALRRATARTASTGASPFRLAALGSVDVALGSTAAVLRASARWIDDHPREDASAVALRCRLAAEACATTVLDEVGRALGAGPYCRDAAFARRAADLPVFIRQSHAQRDFAALGERLSTTEETSWAL